MTGDETTGQRRRAGVRRAFTLIEVMIVIAIILLLTGLVGLAVLGRRDEAKLDICKIKMNTLRDALKVFRFDWERYPTDDEGLAVLWDRNAMEFETEDQEARWKPLVEDPAPTDPWGHEWIYRAESEIREGYFDLISVGPDGEEGTDDDISLWAGYEEGGGLDGFGAPPSGGGLEGP